VGPTVEITGQRYQPEAMVARERLALRRSEAADPIGRFGDPPIEPALTVLVNSLKTEANFHPHGRVLMRVHLRELLETRLRLTQAWNGRPEVPETSLIERPILITGIPRSGSTFLHELVAKDPENRAPRVWEVMFPIPTRNKHPNKVDPRVRKAEACLWWGFAALLQGPIWFTRSAHGRRMSA